MLFEKLGTLDFITVLIIIGAAIMPQKLLLTAAVYLIVKGLIFILLSKDFASYIDLFSGLYLVIFANGIRLPYLHGAVLFWLIQKTILTFIAIGFKLMILYYVYQERSGY